jgi:hypothetical protein
MLPIFLVLLVSGFVSILIALRASHEVPRLLAFVCGIICSIGGFALAPWPIQVLIFLLILRLEWLLPITEAVTIKSTNLPPKRRRK